MRKILGCLCVAAAVTVSGCAGAAKSTVPETLVSESTVGNTVAESVESKSDHGASRMESAYLLPDQFGTDRTVREALSSICDKETYELGDNPDGTMTVKYTARTMWPDQTEDIVLNMTYNPKINSVTPDVMYVGNKKADARYMEAFLCKSEGMDSLSQELLSQWRDGETGSYFAENGNQAAASGNVEKETETTEDVAEDVEDQEWEESEYLLPYSDSEYITKSDLQGMDASELRLARNEIYARHGFIFKADDIYSYFRTKSWYEATVPAADFNYNSLNKYEKKNIDVIKAAEAEKTGKTEKAQQTSKTQQTGKNQISNSGTQRADEFTGTWMDENSQRCMMEITANQGKYSVEISWGSSAMETTTWKFTGTYDDKKGGIVYQNCVCQNETYDNNKKSVDVVYKDGTGLLFMSENGEIQWVSSYNDGDDCAFYPLEN